VAAAAAVILAAAVAFLVHHSGGDGAPAAQAAPGTGTERAAQLWHNLAQCLRTHGHPEFEDPVIDSQGEPDFGAQGAQVKRAVQTLGVSACRAQLAAMPPSEHRRPPTAAELHQMVLFSRCMRAHGLSDWPDPRADGTFPLNQRLMALGKRGILTQVRACGPLRGDGKGIAISPSSSPPGSQKAPAVVNDQ
jgi:hypothetical protein